MPERFAPQTEQETKPIKTYPQVSEIRSHNQIGVSELFSDLPVDPGANLNFLQPFLDQQPIDKEKINNRYLGLMNLRTKHGLPGRFPVNLENAFILLHEEAYSSLVEETKAEVREFHTAQHEIDHVDAAYFIGWGLNYVSIVPGADHLGVTSSSPKKELNMYDWCIESGTISIASVVGHQMRGEVPRGCGSDIANAKAKASLAHKLNPDVSEASIYSRMQNLAHMALAAAGQRGRLNQAETLLYKKVQG